MQKMCNKGTITTSTPPKQLETRLALCFFCMKSNGFKLWSKEWSLQTMEPPPSTHIRKGVPWFIFHLQHHLAWMSVGSSISKRSTERVWGPCFSELGPEPTYGKHDRKICFATICYYCAYSKQPGSKSNRPNYSHTPKLTSFATYNCA